MNYFSFLPFLYLMLLFFCRKITDEQAHDDVVTSITPTNTDTSAPPAEHNTMRQMGQANTCDEDNSEHCATNCKHHDVDSDHSIA